jgi:hypothetical protein
VIVYCLSCPQDLEKILQHGRPLRRAEEGGWRECVMTRFYGELVGKITQEMVDVAKGHGHTSWRGRVQWAIGEGTGQQE